MPLNKWLVTKGQIQTVVESQRKPAGAKRLQPGPLFENDEDLAGIFPQILEDETEDKKTAKK